MRRSSRSIAKTSVLVQLSHSKSVGECCVACISRAKNLSKKVPPNFWTSRYPFREKYLVESFGDGTMRLTVCSISAAMGIFLIWVLVAAVPVESRSTKEITSTILQQARHDNLLSIDQEAVPSGSGTWQSDSTDTKKDSHAALGSSEQQQDHYFSHKLRSRQRRLSGEYGEFSNMDLQSAEAGFAFAVVLFFVLVVMLCCCCCPGTGCSIWDIVACLCIWEICCDRNGGACDDFTRC